MKEIDRFFFEKNIVSENTVPTTNDLGYIEAIKAFSRITYCSIYVIDYAKRTFEFMSDNPLFLCGHTPQEVVDLGYEFYEKHVPTEDLKLLLEVNEYTFNFYHELPLEERHSYSITYDFHLSNEAGQKFMVNHKLTPIFLTDDGKIWKAMCYVSLSTHKNSGNIQISKHNSDVVWEFNRNSLKWEEGEKLKLTERETDILRLYGQSFSIAEIADKLHISAETVKFHRRKLFEKLDVQNISEALQFAKSNKLI